MAGFGNRIFFTSLLRARASQNGTARTIAARYRIGAARSVPFKSRRRVQRRGEFATDLRRFTRCAEAVVHRERNVTKTRSVMSTSALVNRRSDRRYELK